MLHQIALAETAAQQLPPWPMLLRIHHREDAMFREIGEARVPVRLEVLGPDFVDLLEGGEVCDADFGGGEADDGAVLLMERVDVEDALAGYHGAFKAEVREAGVPRAGEVAGWACEGDVYQLEKRSVNCKETM
jgi:hypothetical protein